MNVPFFSTLGMELTWLWPRKTNEYEWISGYAAILNATFRETKFPYFNCHNDGDALEISTPAFSNVEDLKNYYVKLQEQLRRLALAHSFMSGKVDKLVYSRKDTVSGGGHIHVAIPKRIMKDPVWLLLFLTNLFRDLNNRPYLNWMFNDWGNTQSAENFVHFRGKMNEEGYRGLDPVPANPNNWKKFDFLRLLYLKDPKVSKHWKARDILSCFEISKGYTAKVSDTYKSNEIVKPHTIEFRCFDTKKDLAEVESHADFVNSYLRYIEQKTRSGQLISPKIKSVEDIQALAKNDRCVGQFKNIIEELGLDYGNYGRFVETNYRKRAQAGLLR